MQELLGQATVPAGGGRAWPLAATCPARLEAAARPAGPGRTTSRRAERSSRRGRLAGGQDSRRPEIRRGTSNKTPEPGQVPGSGGGGWGIRTPEGLHPTRFPSVRHRPLGESSVHIVPDNHKRKKPPSANPGQWTRSQARNVAEKRVLRSRRQAACPPVIGQGTQ